MKEFFSGKISQILATHGFLVVVLFGAGVAAVTLKGADIVSLLASATTSLSAPAVLYFTPNSDAQLNIGETADIDVNVNARVPINAIGTTIKFPQDMLEVVGVSKQKSFLDLWTEETAINEDEGKVHFSGGTVAHAGLTGTGTAITLTVRAKKSGDAKLYFLDSDLYASDGKGTPVDSTLRSFTYVIPAPPTPPSPPMFGGSGGSVATIMRPTQPSADLDDDKRITIVDISIMTVRIVMPYNARYDLDLDGMVGLSDLSIVLSKMGQSI